MLLRAPSRAAVQGGHKALVFCQTQQMLDIIEKMVGGLGLAYHRMDGSTGVALRMHLMDDFNTNPAIHVFLLTTKASGKGKDLTLAGAGARLATPLRAAALDARSSSLLRRAHVVMEPHACRWAGWAST